MNSGHDYTFRVPSSGTGYPLFRYLAERFRHTDDLEWRRRISSGDVTVDGLPSLPETLLREGQRVVWRRPPWTEP